MLIQWYPGHMAKARRMLVENLKLIDVVVELVDARAPRATRNPDFDDLFSAKQRVILLNKSDLASPAETKAWVEHYRAEGISAIEFVATNSAKRKAAVELIENAASEKVKRMLRLVQLEGYEKPEILTYSLESTIAEKFDAILQRFELTGRMKDFYDIYYLSRTFDFDGLKLQTAIQETLQNRGTTYEKDSFDRVLSLVDDEDMKSKWRYFLRTLGNPDVEFSSVIAGIDLFLAPVWTAITREEELQKIWHANSAIWE